MASDSGFDRGQENSLPATPLSSIMNRFQRFREGLASPRTNDTPPVTSPTSIRSFSETPARTSSNEPPPLNGSVAPTSFVAPTLSNEHQIVPHLVTPFTLLDASSITHELDEFRLQQHATQLITQAEQKMTIDGLDFVFYNGPGSEAPAELTFSIPSLKLYNGAEVTYTEETISRFLGRYGYAYPKVNVIPEINEEDKKIWNIFF